MKTLFILFLCVLLAGCAEAVPPETDANILEETVVPETILPILTEPPETLPPDPVEVLLRSMTLEEWVGQLFLVGADPALAQEQIQQYNLGGFLLFASDFQSGSAGDQICRWQSDAKIPMLIAVDEEGGTVTRVSCHTHYRDSRFPSPRVLYDQGGLYLVLSTEMEKCRLLTSLGVNVNLGPVCDITTDPAAFMYRRSLGQNADTTSTFVSQMVCVMDSYGVGSVMKHFPGYGNNVDTHTGIAVDNRPMEEFQAKDLLPFQAGIDAGCGAILVSHTIVEAFDPELPASLSPAVHRYLREEMGFDGIIITDDLNMQAIADQYGAGEAAVMAVLAGNDLLCATSFTEQYEAVLAAVLDGRIDYDLLKSAVTRVLRWKQDLGLFG